MSYRTIGTCSLCGGAVTVPDIWHGIIPPTPTCSSCGAVAASHGPVIPMRRQQLVPYIVPHTGAYDDPLQPADTLRVHTDRTGAPVGLDAVRDAVVARDVVLDRSAVMSNLDEKRERLRQARERMREHGPPSHLVGFVAEQFAHANGTSLVLGEPRSETERAFNAGAFSSFFARLAARAWPTKCDDNEDET